MYWDQSQIRHAHDAEVLLCIEYNKKAVMLCPKVIIRKSAYHKFVKYVHKTGFQYETGGTLIGYRGLGMFYVIAFTFQPCSDNASKMTFVLDGAKHTRELNKIRKRFVIHPQIIGVWHSHTTEDRSFSLQDRKSNQLLVKQFGRIISAIVIWKNERKQIQFLPFYILKNNRELLCKTSVLS